MVTGILHKPCSWDTIIKQLIWSPVVPLHLLPGASSATAPEMKIRAGFPLHFQEGQRCTATLSCRKKPASSLITVFSPPL